MMRTPKAQTVADLVVELDGRMEGEADAEVLLPAAEWQRLLTAAQDELERQENDAAQKKPRRRSRYVETPGEAALANEEPPPAPPREKKPRETKPRGRPGRATKKFPKGGSDLTEKCTRCGHALGEHDGTECPDEVVAGVESGELATDERGELLRGAQGQLLSTRAGR